MKILLLTQVVPFPPDSGPKVKTHNVLRHLAARHEVHLVSFVRPGPERSHLQALAGACASVTGVPLRRSRARDLRYLARSLVSGRPFLVERDDMAGMHRVIADLVRRHRFDAVHADQLSMAQFALDLPVPLRVLDEHNAVWTIVRRAAEREQPGPRRVLAELEWRKLRAYEGMLCRRFDCVTVVSGEDRRALEAAAGAPFASATIPITVDTEAVTVIQRAHNARHVVSVATMLYPPNVDGVLWFARQAFPLVRRAEPETSFFVVGNRPPSPITALPRTQEGVVVTGYVPDLTPLLRESAVLVVPVHSGSGMRVKILEAFARGIPVVSTTVGIEGISARPGEHLLVGDTPEEFAAAVIRVLREPATADRLARAGRKLVESHYSSRSALARLDLIYPAAEPDSVAA